MTRNRFDTKFTLHREEKTSSSTCNITSLPIIRHFKTPGLLIGIVFLLHCYFPVISVNAQQVPEETHSLTAETMDDSGVPALSDPVCITVTDSIFYFEAEEGVISDGVVESEYTGYTGAGYVNLTNAAGTYLELTLSIPEAGRWNIYIRYANGKTDNRPCEIRVDGSVVNSSFDFPATIDWTDWAYSDALSLDLEAGDHVMRITGNTSSGAPNLDHAKCVFQPGDLSHYSLLDIMETLFVERLQTGDYTLRRACIERIEDIIYGTYPPIDPLTERTYHTMVFKAIMEIKQSTVTQGAVVWQIQNHGFVVKTPSITLGFDLYDYYNYEEFSNLANLLDVYFITHGHRDHFSALLINAMHALGKPVVGPAELPDSPNFENVSIRMNAGDHLTIDGCTVTAHDGGDHSVPVRMYEVVTPEGLKLMHTGDKEYTNTLPIVSDIDILMFNAWISIPTSERTDSTRIEGIRATLTFYQPELAIAGHLIELGHLQYISSTQPAWPLYHNAYSADDGALLCEYRIPAWGERCQYGGPIDDNLPNAIENLTCQIQQDTVILSWDPPLPAADNETATFYRIIVNDTCDYWVDKTEFRHFAGSTFNFKVYAYDCCGNQSEQYREITETTVTVDEPHKKSVPQAYYLAQNFPNPFNPVTRINYQLPKSSFVNLSVYNVSGQLVEILVNENKNAGYHFIVWDAVDVSSGLYFYHISAGEYSAVKKCLILK